MALEPSTIPHDAAVAFSRAKDSCSFLATNNELQGRTCTNTPALQTHSHRRAVLLPLLRRRGTLCSLLGASRTYSVQAYGWNRSPAQTLAHHDLVHGSVNALHLSNVLSKSFASMPHHGAKGEGRVPKSNGELHRSKGEFPNVGC